MALSNKFGWMVLTTGNKSEMAIGYATLYGDMAGGFAVLKDVDEDARLPPCPVAQPRRPCSIPETSSRSRPRPSCAPDQVDADSLPPYDVLDPILEGYVEGDRSVTELEAERVRPRRRAPRGPPGRPREYKRRQAPPGIRVSPKAFGKDRRLPITNGWTG